MERAGHQMSITIKKITASSVSILAAVLITACQTASQNTVKQATDPGVAIDATPVQQGEGSWKIATADTVTLTVSAPGAQSVRIRYRPLVETDRHILLKTIKAPSESGKFLSTLKLVPDFAGEVWAEASFPDGTKKETQPIELAAQDSLVAKTEGIPTNGSTNKNGASRRGESAHSDKFTGGKIDRASLQPGQPDINITVNVPAFRLTLWQNGKEVRTYEIGVGMKKFPIVIGQRRVTQVIWNPEWVPPDSEWVIEGHSDVEPGERVKAGDPRNPLGKLKIPLGDGFLIHQAAKPADLGHLVSHGCIRMLKDDIADLANSIVTARGLNIRPEQIARAMTSTDRLAAKLDPPIVVDVDYDTVVVEGGVLHIYPDVYERNTNTLENLRAELQSAGADVTRLDDETLKQMFNRVNMNEEFKVNVSDIQTGNALLAGTNQPLTSQSVVAKKQRAAAKPRAGRRGRR
jgi:lipoprotein-anchoring transpeptidase ErfK/SrfK